MWKSKLYYLYPGIPEGNSLIKGAFKESIWKVTLEVL